MRTIGLLAALAMATAAPAMAMNSERGHQNLGQAQVFAASSSAVSSTAQPCRRVVDRFGNIRIICPNRWAARAAWRGRRRSYPRNFMVLYRDGGRMRVWGQWRPPVRRR
jgi:hypothetical protein